MEVHKENSPQLEYPIDGDDAKYVSGLSTILVATIQEAKDRISQIEYIFCSQLYPNFQSKSKNLQKIYSETRKAAEDVWKKKENNLLFQIEKLKLEKKLALEENQSLKLEKAKLSKGREENLAKQESLEKKVGELERELRQRSKEVVEGVDSQKKLLQLVQSKASVIVNKGNQLKEHEEKANMLLTELRSLEKKVDELQEELTVEKAKPSKEQEEDTVVLLSKQESLEKKVGELEWELQQRSKEVDEGMELQKKLLKLVQSKASVIVNKGNQLKEHEEKANMLLAELSRLEKRVNELQEELTGKNEEVNNGKELQKDLLKKIELQASKIMNNDQILIGHENEKKLLTAKLECLEENVAGLQKELKEKTDEVKKEKKLREQLLQQINLNGSETLKNERPLEEHEKEKKLLLAKLKCLEEKVEELQVNLRERNREVAKERESYDKLVQCIELKASESVSEKNKTNDAIAAYKRLKSQYNFVCKKFGLTADVTLTLKELEEKINSLRHQQNILTSPVACNTIKLNDEIGFQEKSDDGKRVGLIQPSHSTSFVSPGVPKNPTEVRSAPLAGIKRSASHWRDTRSRQCQGGPDPHDDFLDTPYENIRGNLNKVMKEEIQDLPVPVPKDMNFDSSDDETQDMNVDPSSQKQKMSVPKPSTRGYKYVEPVRKKAERENLKGIECKQCKKFYDAVLPDAGGIDADGNKQNFRCEHHDGVSRHRYRYVPPLTPEGFWNIGFDSEM